MCKPSQSQGNQTGGPILSAPQGSRLALRYLENGHITQPYSPPNKANSGLVSVYATTQPSEDELFLPIHGQWTADQTGGDKRGYLIASTPFDDGECFQFDPTFHSNIANVRDQVFGPGDTLTEAPNRWCHTFVPLNDAIGNPIPSNTIVTLYWVWDWPSTLSGNAGDAPTLFNETYTSCIDVQIV